MEIQPNQHKYPFCIVWTPIPLISWLFPIIGHIGIGTSKGVIRDFAGSYFVSEDEMAFGWPTLYCQLSPQKVIGGVGAWDSAINEASEVYRSHAHNLFTDNCHSHVALALNKMHYGGKIDWNMFTVWTTILLRGKFVSSAGFLRQYLPFTLIWTTIISIVYLSVA